MKYILETKNLNFEYPDKTKALNDVSIKLPKGQTIAVLGSNGAGKSTLFLNLNGILKPKSGEVFFEDKKVNTSKKEINEMRRKVGIVFQDPDNQLFSASVYEDVSFGVLNLKVPEDEARKRVDDAIKKIGIEEIKDKPTFSLSFGQEKRVAIAGVIAMNPEVLILDEPTAGLDPSGVSEIMKLVRSIQSELAISVILSTHDIDIVPLYADYVYVMEKGAIILEGTPEDIFKSPEILRGVGLRLPRIAHLMEILEKEDNIDFEKIAITISGARKEIRSKLK